MCPESSSESSEFLDESLDELLNQPSKERVSELIQIAWWIAYYRLHKRRWWLLVSDGRLSIVDGDFEA
jgi:hypothetical protein